MNSSNINQYGLKLRFYANSNGAAPKTGNHFGVVIQMKELMPVCKCCFLHWEQSCYEKKMPCELNSVLSDAVKTAITERLLY